MSEPSKFAENQFLTSTENNLSLMGEFLSATYPRVVHAASLNPAFESIRGELQSIIAVFDAAESIVTNQEALLPTRTLAFEDKLASLTRKPDLDTNSILETWHHTLTGQVAIGSTTYAYLLPSGRETLTAGTYDQRLDAGRAFGLRLGEQTTKPVLVTLKNDVDAFYNAARLLRDSQNSTKSTLTQARLDLEALRKVAAAILYALAGIGMNIFRNEPAKVDTLFDIDLLRNPPQTVPPAPADTTWTPATRTLATTALPPGATRLEAWRRAPGGAPELLEIGPTGSTTVTIPTLYTFDPGDLYQLWLQARNSKGTSPPGPLQNWTP